MRRWGVLVAAVVAPVLVGAEEEAPPTAAAVSTEERRDWKWWLDNEYYKVDLNIRPRLELANLDGRDFSQSWTVRSRVGIGNEPWHGLRGYAEMEGTFSFAPDAYWDTVSRDNGKTPVADPENIELNQAFLEYRNDDLLGASFRGGRQRIVFDDARFVGDVVWRQNEQTFDAIRAGSNLGLEGLELDYAYLFYIQRIFGDQGGAGTRDFKSNSNLIRLHYKEIENVGLTAFTYLLDFGTDAAALSANTFGFRATGALPFGDGWKFGWTGSYAYQVDAARNPVDYDAHYAWASASIGYAPVATLEVGYELLGSDDGAAVFSTPLATAHKFNGFADTFLDNGGPNGLQDLFVSLAPALPWKIQGKLIYHQFWADETGRRQGQELDFVVTRPVWEYVTLLMKGAFYWGPVRGPANRYRLDLEANFAF